MYTMESNPSHIQKKYEILTLATWMGLEIITSREKSQTQKDKYHMISCSCGI
jgi:hypothetical protein